MTSTRQQMFEGVGAPVEVELEGGHIDPTLDSCCQREIESNRKRSAVETALRAHDRVARAEDRRRQHQPHSLPDGGRAYNPANLIHGMTFGSGCRCCYDPNGDGGEYELLAEARKERGGADDGDVVLCGLIDEEEKKDAGGSKDDGSNDSDSDDEFDYLLDDDLPVPGANSEYDALQAGRRAELENKAKHYEVARHHGYGVHRQMHPQRVFASVGYGADQVRDRICPKGAVLHLYDAFSPLSVSLDLCLEEMAGRYPGTKFARGIGVTSVLYAEDGSADWKRGEFPLLLALRDGRVVAYSSGLRDFAGGGEEVESKAVEQWLDRAGVLVDSPPPLDALCRIRPEEEMLLENMRKLNGLGSGMLNREMKREEDLEEERYDCGVAGCNKGFFHEHVGVKTEAQDGLLVTESQVASSTG